MYNVMMLGYRVYVKVTINLHQEIAAALVTYFLILMKTSTILMKRSTASVAMAMNVTSMKYCTKVPANTHSPGLVVA